MATCFLKRLLLGGVFTRQAAAGVISMVASCPTYVPRSLPLPDSLILHACVVYVPVHPDRIYKRNGSVARSFVCDSTRCRSTNSSIQGQESILLILGAFRKGHVMVTATIQNKNRRKCTVQHLVATAPQAVLLNTSFPPPHGLSLQRGNPSKSHLRLVNSNHSGPITCSISW